MAESDDVGCWTLRNPLQSLRTSTADSAVLPGQRKDSPNVAHVSFISTHEGPPRVTRLGVMDDLLDERLLGIPMTASDDVDVYSGVARLSGRIWAREVRPAGASCRTAALLNRINVVRRDDVGRLGQPAKICRVVRRLAQHCGDSRRAHRRA